jgi:hypothetical protein
MRRTSFSLDHLRLSSMMQAKLYRVESLTASRGLSRPDGPITFSQKCRGLLGMQGTKPLFLLGMENIIQTARECTPGPEVPGVKRTDVLPLSQL